MIARRCLAVAVSLSALACGCGKNLSDPGSPPFVGPPKNVTALAVDASTVRLRWQTPDGVADSLVKSYRIAYNGIQDSVSGGAHQFAARFLIGPTTFVLATRLRSGVTSDGAGIRWAPAARFDTAIVLIENSRGEVDRLSGLHAGGRTGSPRALSLTADNSPLLHLFLTGEGGQPLQLLSASRYIQNWNVTLFSTVSNASTSLDYDLASYPSEYSLDNVTLNDNTIYYARVAGAPGEVHSVRIHVRLFPGEIFPNRRAALTISLQRQPGIEFALGPVPLRHAGHPAALARLDCTPALRIP